MLAEILAFEVFALMLVFVRLGTAFMVMPVVGEAYISPRIRLLLAMAFSVVVAPVVQDAVPPIPTAGVLAIGLLILAEITVGLFLGGMVRIMVAALATTGTIIAFISGFANAVLFNPALEDQGSLQSVFLTLLGILMILATDLHHVMLTGLVESYMVFQPGAIPRATMKAKSPISGTAPG